MELSKVDIAKAFGLTLHKCWDVVQKGEACKEYCFKLNGREIWITGKFEVSQAWEAAAEEFLKPLEDVLFGDY